MTPKRITLLVLASTFPRWKNDSEPRFVYDLCLHLKNDFDIIVLAPHSKGSQCHELFNGLTVLRYRYGLECLENLAYEGGITAKLKSNRFNWLMLPSFFIGQWVAIVRVLKKYPVDAIHAHWLIPQGVLALVARIVSKNKPVVLCTSHGGDLYGLNDPVSKILKRYTISHVDKLAVVSSSMQNEVKKLTAQVMPSVVAPMGANLEHLFTPDNSVQRADNHLLFVGRLVEKKGLKYLLEAVANIAKNNTQITLNIVGTGTEQLRLERQIQKLNIASHVNFLGRLTHQQLVEQYRKTTLAVFPFIQAKSGDIEGLGLVMIEAMGCMCPIIASDIPAVHDVIVNDETGFLVQKASPLCLQSTIQLLLKSPEKRKSIAYNGYKSVNQKFSWEASAKHYRSILNTLVDKH